MFAKHYLKENGLEMIFVFETPKKFILISSLHSKLQATVISDAEKALYKLYHIENSTLKLIGSMFKSGFKAQIEMAKSLDLDNFEDEKKVSTIIPADFLIDENGQIANLHYGSAINDHYRYSCHQSFCIEASRFARNLVETSICSLLAIFLSFQI